MFSKSLVKDDDDDEDPLLEVSILECLFIGGGGMGMDMVGIINGRV